MYKSLLLAFLCLSTFLSAQDKGTFKISTKPQYAYISLDGFPDIQKKTPAEFEGYRALSYRIKVSKHNYHDLDTIVTCYSDSIAEYHFDLVPKTGSLNITTIPEHASVYFNNQPIGITPLNDFPVPCGANTIRIVSAGHGEFSNTYVINEDMPLSIIHDFTQSTIVNNNRYRTPVETGFEQPYYTENTYDTEEPLYPEEFEDSDVINKSGFGHVGFFGMVGSNGAKGTSWRYGADIMHYLRVFGETNSTSNIKGFGLEVVLPADLDQVAIYGKMGVVARTYDGSFNQNITTRFVTFGGGLSIKPSPHFQIFSEFEIGFYDEEQHPDDVQYWKEQFPNYSAVTGWLGIRVAL